MKLPFSPEQFFEVIRSYNESVWPAQVLLTVLAVGALALLGSKRAWAGRAIWAVLALLWAWIGIVYQLAFFTKINPAAYAFGVLFLVGAAVFLRFALAGGPPAFVAARDLRSTLGLGLIGYALVVYPWWSSVGGHAYPDLPTFGLPCPTTIFTIGMLAMARGGRTWPAYVAPVLWSLVGVQAAFLLAVLPDLGLGVAGLIAIGLAARGSRSAAPLARA